MDNFNGASLHLVEAIPEEESVESNVIRIRREAGSIALNAANASINNRIDNMSESNYNVYDNNGNIHTYFYEQGDTYYGYYEKIKDGQVESVPVEQYYMLSPTLYISRDGSGEIISLDDDNEAFDEAHYVVDGDIHSTIFVKDGAEKYRFNYSVDDEGNMHDKEMVVHDPTGLEFCDDPERAKLTFDKDIEGDLELYRLITDEGLTLPQVVEGNLYLNKLAFINKLDLPQFVGKNIYLSNLLSAEDVQFSQHIGGSLYLNGLAKAKNITLSEYVGCGVDLNNLRYVENSALPQHVGGDLHIPHLIYANNFTLSQFVGGRFVLNIPSAEGLVVPRTVLHKMRDEQLVKQLNNGVGKIID